MDPRLKEFLDKVFTEELNTACVCELLAIYYDCIVWGVSDPDDIFEESPYPEELTLPLENRKSGILTALSSLMDSNHDINRSDGISNALTFAVGSGDHIMTRFLLEHGADANDWPEKMGSDDPHEQNYYLDDIDINLLHDNWVHAEYREALCRTAEVLAEVAKLGPYYGYCFRIDESGKVSFGPVRKRF